MKKIYHKPRLFSGFLGKLALLIAIGFGTSGLPAILSAAEADLATSSEAAEGEARMEATEQEAIQEEMAFEDSDLDPWEPFNEKMFNFNRQMDRYVLKPVAGAYDTVLPDPVQRGVRNAIDNLSVVPRLVNNMLQLKIGGFSREVTRFTVNSTLGLAGLFDVAKDMGIEQSDEDTGQTFGVYGVGPGPYLVLPFLPVMTVRDGIGYVADGAMNPLNYFLPFGARAGIVATDTVNERSLHLEEFQSVEETVIDLYGAVRNAYLQRRAKAVLE